MDEFYYEQKGRGEDAIQWERVAKLVDRRKLGMKYFLKYRKIVRLIPPEPFIIEKDESPSTRITLYKKHCEKMSYPYVEKIIHCIMKIYLRPKPRLNIKYFTKFIIANL